MISDELPALRQLLRALESGQMRIVDNGTDVTQREIQKLGPDIAYLEKAITISAKEIDP
jgi:hypothetical protein